LGIGQNEFVLASVGKYIERKRHPDVIRAWLTLPTSLRSRSRVLLIGEGPQRRQLEQMAAETGGRIILTGFLNQQEMPFYYNACDVLVVASEIDPHPLVVTESLFLGLPVIISHRAGCIGPDDTVRAGENGLVYPCGDIAALAEAMESLLSDDELRQRFSTQSRAIAQGQDVVAVSSKFVKAFGDVAGSQQPTLIERARRAISV
jgi:glycosyltransferase involved in cell wall biosynthesis